MCNSLSLLELKQKITRSQDVSLKFFRSDLTWHSAGQFQRSRCFSWARIGLCSNDCVRVRGLHGNSYALVQEIQHDISIWCFAETIKLNRLTLVNSAWIMQ